VSNVSIDAPAPSFDLRRRLVSEMLGTLLLLAVVVGSGIMAERLSGGNVAIALLGNTMATGAALVVLITIFVPISGAHFNPAVTLAFFLKKDIEGNVAAAYIMVQIIGAILGVYVAHAMFSESIFQVSTKIREGGGQIFSEAVATFGLLLTIFGSIRFRPHSTPMLVGLYITAAYWFTASTSFANPAVTLARSLSNTFAGIDPQYVAGFIVAQIVGAVVALYFSQWFFKESDRG
jgi:glycerol uptake facilitator-like aquaporin